MSRDLPPPQVSPRSVRARAMSNAPRRRSFRRHENFSIPVLPIAGLEEKRAALLRAVHHPAGQSGCVELPSDVKCPQSFGNMQLAVLTALLTAHALGARLQTSSAMDCNGLLRFKAGERVMLSAADAPPASVVSMDTPEICDLLASSGTNTLADGTCTRLPSTHDQTIPWCLQRGLKAHPLFALGPHAALGAVFDSAFALRNENVPAWLDEEELRISVHIRHFDDGSLGSEPLGAFEAAIREAIAAASAKRCALLVASDRRLTLHLMEDVARRIGCRLATSARRAPARDYSAEHGEDTGAVLLQDVFLLARGHVLIGSWGSTLTLLIQGLVAARSIGSRLPTVTYCQPTYSQWQCMRPLPLLTSERNRWWVSIDSSGATEIASFDGMERALEWSEREQVQRHEDGQRRDTTLLTLASGGQAHKACTVSLLKQFSKGGCVLNSTFGYDGECQSNRHTMWVQDGCRGRFRCNQFIIDCGFKRQNNQRHSCTCKRPQGLRTTVWPHQSDTLEALRLYAWPAQRPTHSVAWLGAIISRSKVSARYAATAKAVASCGFEPAHVAAAMPQDYTSLDDMLVELFGIKRRVAQLSPFELGLLISHKRALALIARGSHAWGAVFEDDAYLHEEIAPSIATSLLGRTFAEAAQWSVTNKRPTPLLYLGSCSPQCERELHNQTKVGGLPLGMVRSGHCHAYCTHAYALTRSHATSFFADVFGCNNGAATCGVECEHRPCFMDWAIVRHLKRGSEGWVVAGGLRSRWNAGHHGLFVQDRSKVAHNSTGTLLHRKFRWKSSAVSCPVLPVPGATLRKVLVSIKWSGRLGNLLFEWAALMGVVARLRSIAPTEAIALHLPALDVVPARALFEQFGGLSKHMRVEWRSSEVTLSDAYADKLRCDACMHRMDVASANLYDETALRRLDAWVAKPPDNCQLGLVELSGYFQSYKYFDATADSIIHPALAAPIAATRRAAEYILASARRSLPRRAFLVGVQVRLGDKVSDAFYKRLYAPTSWEYYREAMRHLQRELGDDGGSLGFIVTAGGSLESNAKDLALAKEQLSNVADHVFFSTAADPHVDLAVLRGCDSLVIGPSTLGWWAAYLARLPAGRVIAPLHVYHPSLPRSHRLVRGFSSLDYYPPEWLLLPNNGNLSEGVWGTYGKCSKCTERKKLRIARRPREVRNLSEAGVLRAVRGEPRRGTGSRIIVQRSSRRKAAVSRSPPSASTTSFFAGFERGVRMVLRGVITVAAVLLFGSTVVGSAVVGCAVLRQQYRSRRT